MAASYLPDWARSRFNTWSGPQVSFTLPPSDFFKFPPDPAPAVLPSPPDNPNLAHPFTIPSDIYNDLLSAHVPLTVALVYATTVTFLNGVNARRNNKPWPISKTWIFTVGVLLHNLLLAVYSAWTCVGMVNALRLSYVHYSSEYGPAGAVDALCKLHGPRGIGSAATYNGTRAEWGIYNTAYRLSSTFLPEHSDVGRIWNEGLAFYGWLFYISKFYEVVDTFIIIAKGKQSSFLQTYHHAGAMMCMWAGIRYMSPPIWMFVMVNSFIHAVMYTFYFFTALRIRVPKPLKQLLTTMQIAQFLMGSSYAFLHLFIKYQVPVKTPYIVHIGQKIVEGASGLGADAAAQFTSAMAAATATADTESWLKKFALRAAGREGLAENVLNKRGQTFGIDAAHAVSDFVSREEVRYHDELKWTHCLDTSGQTFAIYLNLFYLLPLTGLFVQFFVNSYLKRAEVKRRQSLGDHVAMAGRSLSDARKGVSRRLSEAFEDSQGWNGEVQQAQTGVVIDSQRVREQLRRLDEQMRNKADEIAVKTRDVEDIKDSVQEKTQAVKEKASQVVSQVPSTEETKAAVDNNTNGGSKKAKKKAKQAAAAAQETAQKATTETSELVQSVSQQIAGSTGMDLDDVLKKAWATVDSSKGKSNTSSSEQTSSQQTSTSSQRFSSSNQATSSSSYQTLSSQEVSSTTVFESSSISKSSQDEVIDSSQIVRDEDVDTNTGKAKKDKEGLQMIASNVGDFAVASVTAPTTNIPADNPVIRSGREHNFADGNEHEQQSQRSGAPAVNSMESTSKLAMKFQEPVSQVQQPEPGSKAYPSSLPKTGQNAIAAPLTPEMSNSSSSSQSDPFDEFSQTRPASSSTHASPSKTATKTVTESDTRPSSGRDTAIVTSTTTAHITGAFTGSASGVIGGRLPRPINPVITSSILSNQTSLEPSDNSSTLQPQEKSRHRSTSPAKKTRSMIPGPAPATTKATNIASTRKSSPQRNLVSSTSSIISSPIPSSVIDSTNTNKQMTIEERESQSPQSPKWHSRRRGQKQINPSNKDEARNDEHDEHENETSNPRNNHKTEHDDRITLENSTSSLQETPPSSSTKQIQDEENQSPRHVHGSRKKFNMTRDEIEDVTSLKGDDDSFIL